jgi:proline iminopeptidase
LTGTDAGERVRAAKAWSVWEAKTSCLIPNEQLIAKNAEDEYALAFARIECHYFVNDGFFDRDDELLVNASKIQRIPGVIVQGRYDVVCPAESAWALHRAWPQAKLKIVGDAGHAALELGTLHELITATDSFR